MDKKINHMELTKEPIYKPEDIESILLQLIADPNCRHTGCHGRGYTGIGSNGGILTVTFCKCARFGKTDYVKAMERIDALEKSLHNQYIRLMGFTLLGRCRLIWISIKDLRKYFKRGGAIPKAPTTEPAPK